VRKKILCLALCALLFALCVPAEAQQQGKIPKIGWLSARRASNTGQEIIIRMLRDLGYVEGKNISFEYRFADDKLDRLPALADELVRLRVDVLLTPGTPGALALKKATQTIPIVFLDVTDPVAAGLVDSLARPGGNITGFSSIETMLAGKRLELLRKPFRNFLGLRSCGILGIQPQPRNGKRAKSRRENSACNFILWK
jgi:putative tryptophan/tyrosine transport system substrate-binding protein